MTGREQGIADRISPFGEVLSAFLFGSRAEGSPRPDSDTDIAVFLSPGLTPAERWELRLRIAAALEDLRPDAVVLHDAPSLLGQRALSGTPLFMRDPGRTCAASWRRSPGPRTSATSRGSTAPPAGGASGRADLRDGEVFDRRLARLEEVLGHLRGPSAWPREQFLRDPGLQAQAERWLQLAAECTPDHANHLVAERGWRTPQSCRDSMRVLHEHEVIAEHLSRRMEAWAGLRKVLVHLHLDVGHERLWEVLSRDLDDLEAFAVAVSSRSG